MELPVAGTSSDYFSWLSSDGGRSVQFSRDAMKKLHTEVMRGFGKTRRRGTECGGLLLGSKDISGRLTIEDFQIVPCEYAFGPSYNLSEKDELAFRQAVALAGSSVVGFFRSDTRNELAVDDLDSRLFSEVLGSNGHVALLLRPFATKVPVAKLVFPAADGKLTGGRITREFAFSPSLTDLVEEIPIAAAAAAPDAAPALSPLPVSASVVEESLPPAAELGPDAVEGDTAAVQTVAAERTQVYPEDNERALSRVLGRDVAPMLTKRPAQMHAPSFGGLSHLETPEGSRISTPVLAVLFAGLLLVTGVLAGFQMAGGRVQFRPHLQFQRPDPTQGWVLGLNVAPAGERIRVSWDPEAVAARSATRGKLTVADGPGEPTVIEMPATEIRNGSVLHFPTTNRIRFTLELQLPNQRSVSETADWSR